MKSNISEIAKLGEQLANWFADNVSTFKRMIVWRTAKRSSKG
jgi:hypothetical protein